MVTRTLDAKLPSPDAKGASKGVGGEESSYLEKGPKDGPKKTPRSSRNPVVILDRILRESTAVLWPGEIRLLGKLLGSCHAGHAVAQRTGQYNDSHATAMMFLARIYDYVMSKEEPDGPCESNTD